MVTADEQDGFHLCYVMRFQTYWQICYSCDSKKVHVRHQCTIRKQICTVNRVHVTLPRL